MAGLGRRSHYRKHLTDAVINDYPEPNVELGECIARVLGSRGGNILEIEVAQPSPKESDKTLGSESISPTDTRPSQNTVAQLAILPTKFRKLVWVKRGDYVIVFSSNEKKEDDMKVRFLVKHILFKDQVKHLKTNTNFWPGCFSNDVETTNNSSSIINQDVATTNDPSDDEFDPYADTNDDDLFVNTNRVSALTIDDSSSSDESDA